METPKYAYIDVMRGIAIVLVIITHTAQSVGLPKNSLFGLTQFCQFGVQMFFVASALTLYLSMSKRGASKPEVKHFYLRRLFRIAPLYYVGIAFYFLLARLAPIIATEHGLAYTPLNVAANALFLHGLYEPANNAVVPGGWSIGCEMLFYALFPLIFVLINTQRKAVAFLAVSLALNLLGQFILDHFFHAPLRNNGFRYYFLTTQLPVFGCGILLYFALQGHMTRAKSLLSLSGAIFLFFVSFILWHELARLPWGIMLLPTLVGGACALLGHVLAQANLSNILARGLASIGQKSFSLYIFHFVFAWNMTRALTATLEERHIGKPALYLPVMIMLTLALSYSVAQLTYRFIEETGIGWGKKVARGFNARPLSR